MSSVSWRKNGHRPKKRLHQMNIATVNVHVTLAADPKTGEIVFKFSGESKLVGSDGSIDLVNFKKNEAVEIRFQLLTQQITSRVGTVTKSRRVTFSLPGKKIAQNL